MKNYVIKENGLAIQIINDCDERMLSNISRTLTATQEIEELDRECILSNINEQTEEELAQNELFDLKYWFDNIYTYKEQKYRRLIALNKLDDDGIDGQTKLNKLYKEAEEKRTKIQELE